MISVSLQGLASNFLTLIQVVGFSSIAAWVVTQEISQQRKADALRSAFIKELEYSREYNIERQAEKSNKLIEQAKDDDKEVDSVKPIPYQFFLPLPTETYEENVQNLGVLTEEEITELTEYYQTVIQFQKMIENALEHGSDNDKELITKAPTLMYSKLDNTSDEALDVLEEHKDEGFLEALKQKYWS